MRKSIIIALCLFSVQVVLAKEFGDLSVKKQQKMLDAMERDYQRIRLQHNKAFIETYTVAALEGCLSIPIYNFKGINAWPLNDKIDSLKSYRETYVALDKQLANEIMTDTLIANAKRIYDSNPSNTEARSNYNEIRGRLLRQRFDSDPKYRALSNSQYLAWKRSNVALMRYIASVYHLRGEIVQLDFISQVEQTIINEYNNVKGLKMAMDASYSALRDHYSKHFAQKWLEKIKKEH